MNPETKKDAIVTIFGLQAGCTQASLLLSNFQDKEAFKIDEGIVVIVLLDNTIYYNTILESKS